MNERTKNKQYLVKDIIWAKERLNDVLFGCVLNIKLYDSGICSKHISDMSEKELEDYTCLLEQFFVK
jgi:hypothetical protein